MSVQQQAVDDQIAAVERYAAVNALRAATLAAQFALGDTERARVLGVRLNVEVIL
jgi:hypothetical protein